MSDINNLVNFWNDCFSFDENEKIEVEDIKNLAPSEKLYNALEVLSKQKRVLDYGAGHGWASIILAKNGCCDITSVDMAPNAIKLGMAYAKIYEVNNCISFKVIDENYLNNELDNIYDGIFCSNVLDVVPIDVTKSILEFFNRIIKKDGLIAIGLNYYLDLNIQREGFVIEGKNVYINNVLRLVSLTDEEWSSLFSKWFDIEKIDHFAWPGEQVERRRIFYLRKK